MRPSPSVEIGMRISSPTCASGLWSRASSTVHCASGSSTSATTCLTIQASNFPVSMLKWARTGSLMRCCFFAADAMASSMAVTHLVSSISFSRATRRRSSPSWTSAVCAALAISLVPLRKRSLELDLEARAQDLRHGDGQELAGRRVVHQGATPAPRLVLAQPHQHGALALAGRLVGDPRQAAREAAEVLGPVERAVQAGRAHLEGV